MKRANEQNINTPPIWDALYQGIRQSEIQAILQVGHILGTLASGGKTVLDVGCGPGRYFNLMGYPNTKIYGIELSLYAVNQCKKLFPLADVVQGDVASGLPYPENKFDIVYAGEILEHIDAPDKMINEIYRVLKPKGLIVLNTPFENHIPCKEHVWYFSYDDMKTLLKSFSWRFISRIENGANWEHFFAIAEK